MKLPKTVRCLPGWVVKVRVVPGKWLNEHYSIGPAEALEGVWDQSAMTIFLLKSLPGRKKLRVYYHEMVHCLNDWNAWQDEL